MKNQALNYNTFGVDEIVRKLKELGYKITGNISGNPYIVAFPDQKIAGFVNEQDISTMNVDVHLFADKFFYAIANFEPSTEQVDHPAHYGGADNPYEAVKVIAAHNLDFFLGNVIKYIIRSDKKGNELQDLRKAAWYLNKKIDLLSKRKKIITISK